MKKIVLIFFALLFCLGVNAQSADLYDANFDAPRNVPFYDENTQVFQDIYLQYEEAIRRSEESIRSEEKNIRQDDAQKLQANLSLEQEKAQQEQKKHQEELTQVQTKFEQELAQEREKAEEEQKKHQEELSQVQTKFEQELAQEQKKAQEDLSQTQNKFEKELAQEREKAQQDIAQALEKQKQEIYANEIEQLRKDEYEKLSTELHDVLTKELTEKFAAEYENKVKQLTAEYDAEYEKKLKEASDKQAQEYDAKIAEIERQKESEMEAWKKENKKQALEETNARTERMRIIAPYIAGVIAVAAIILLGWLLAKIIIKKKHEKNAKQKELDARNQQIEIYKAEYLNRLKRVGSSNIYRDEIKNIYEEINDSQESDAIKTLRKEAVQQADKEFDSSRITSSIAEYRKIFDGLNPKRHFNTWNGLDNDDIEAKKAVVSEFLANIADYEKYAISACNSKNDQTEIANMLKPYVPVLKSNSEQLASMKDSESDESLKEQLSDLSDKYQELADKFYKGKF